MVQTKERMKKENLKCRDKKVISGKPRVGIQPGCLDHSTCSYQPCLLPSWVFLRLLVFKASLSSRPFPCPGDERVSYPSRVPHYVLPGGGRVTVPGGDGQFPTLGLPVLKSLQTQVQALGLSENAAVRRHTSYAEWAMATWLVGGPSAGC